MSSAAAFAVCELIICQQDSTDLHPVVIEAAMVAAFATGPNAGENKVGLGFGVFAFYAFVAVYGFGIDVCGVVWYSEIFPNHIRAKGICMSIATIALTDLVYLQATATAFANIGWHFYLLFICTCSFKHGTIRDMR